MKLKFIKKYMRFAKFIGEDQPVCYSRQIGAVITNAEGTRILGCGYNGPPRGVPHCDTCEFLEKYFYPKLKEKDFDYILSTHGLQLPVEYPDFIDKFSNKKICPRRLVGAGSGERTDLCPAQHAERNAIINAACDLTNAHLFCWCPVPCTCCAGAIIQAGISVVHCLDSVYDERSLWLFEKSGVTLTAYNKEEL